MTESRLYRSGEKRTKARTGCRLQVESLEPRQLLAVAVLNHPIDPATTDPPVAEGEVRTTGTVAEELQWESGTQLERIPGFSKLEFKPSFLEDADSHYPEEVDPSGYEEAETRLPDINKDKHVALSNAYSVTSGVVDQESQPNANDVTPDCEVSYAEEGKTDVGNIAAATEPCPPVSAPNLETELELLDEEKEAIRLLGLTPPKLKQAADEFEKAGRKRATRAENAIKGNSKGEEKDVLKGAKEAEKSARNFELEKLLRKEVATGGAQDKAVKTARLNAATMFELAADIYERILKNDKIPQDGLSDRLLKEKVVENYQKGIDQLDDNHDKERKIKDRLEDKKRKAQKIEISCSSFTVLFTNPLVYGQTAGVQVTASVPGFLDAWFDFGTDGQFSYVGDQIFASRPLTAGVNNLSFKLPAISPLANETFVRFRFSTQVGHDGPIPGSEVEDYVVNTFRIDGGDGSNAGGGSGPGHVFLDYGDLPDIYKTNLSSNGARHSWGVAGGNIWLGQYVDPEADGQPDILAHGDDNNHDDEDGVVFTSALRPGTTATINVTASADVTADAGGHLSVWIDFNGDGDFEDVGEEVIIGKLLNWGANTLEFPVPDIDIPLKVYSRFRFSTVTVQKPFGWILNNGEVEDYSVFTVCQPEDADTPREVAIVTILSQLNPEQMPDCGGPIWDFGDAPESYDTVLTDDGPRHKIVPGFHLGAGIDAETDGQPSSLAKGDDVVFMDDEDGVTFVTSVAFGQPVTIKVNASAAGKLDGWLDFVGDGSFLQSIDHIFDSEPLVAGINILTFPSPTPNVPLTELQAMARFRFSSAGGLDHDGPALDGEVEDYSLLVNHRPPHGEPLPQPGPDRIPGDADGDGHVGFIDFLVLSNNFGKRVDRAFTDADFNIDSKVDFEDFLILSAKFGTQSVKQPN